MDGHIIMDGRAEDENNAILAHSSMCVIFNRLSFNMAHARSKFNAFFSTFDDRPFCFIKIQSSQELLP